MQRWPLSRRTFLRGTGVALGLPALEAMGPPARGENAGGETPPKRIAFMYFPNGVIHDSWKPQVTGPGYSLPFALEPLAPVREDVTVVSGLSQIPYEQEGGVGHARPTTALLTGTVAEKENVRAGKSFDQMLAEHIGGETRFPSLHLSVSPTLLNGRCDSGYSCAYSSCISWRNETNPVPNDHEPASVFRRLFGDPSASKSKRRQAEDQSRRASVLDSVLEDARDLRRRLGKADQQKLEEYLYSLRQVERRVRSVRPRADGHPSMPVPDEEPGSYGEHVRLMGDLMVLAFQTDATRVATFMLGSAASEQTFPMVGVREGHHTLSHQNRKDEAITKLRKIDRFNVSLYAYVLQRMKEVKEDGGTLLDHSIVYCGSGLGDGGAHRPFDLPVLIGGRGGGTIKPGHHIAQPLHTPLNNLWVGLADAMGAPIKSFGDSTGPLKPLRV